MADTCKYKVIVKGKKNACYAFYGSTPFLYDKSIISEKGTDDKYEMHFQGNCKYAIDMYCHENPNVAPVELPADYKEAQQKGIDDYMYNTVQNRSILFDLEVQCNSMNVDAIWEIFESPDDIDEDVAQDELGEYEHYKSGKPVNSKMPKKLKIDIDY